MERIFSRGTPLYSANLRQDLILGISALESQRLTVAWLISKSAASWLGRRFRRRITSFRNETIGTSCVLTPTFYTVIPRAVNSSWCLRHEIIARVIVYCYVATVLSQEAPEVQRIALAIFSITYYRVLRLLWQRRQLPYSNDFNESTLHTKQF